MKKNIHNISEKIINHSRRTIRSVREKPYETRHQIIVFLTALFTGLIIIGWVALLRYQFKGTATPTSTVSPTQLIKQDINRVYTNATENVEKIKEEN